MPTPSMPGSRKKVDLSVMTGYALPTTKSHGVWQGIQELGRRLTCGVRKKPDKHPLPNASVASESYSCSLDVCFSTGDVLGGSRSFHSCTSADS